MIWSQPEPGISGRAWQTLCLLKAMVVLKARGFVEGSGAAITPEGEAAFSAGIGVFKPPDKSEIACIFRALRNPFDDDLVCLAEYYCRIVCGHIGEPEP